MLRLNFLCSGIYLCMLFTFCKVSSDNSHTQQSPRDKSIIRPGNSNLVPGITISGAVIMSDYGDFRDNDADALINDNNTTSVNVSVQQTVSPTQSSEVDYIAGRIRNVELLMNELPFGVTKWPAVFTAPCPQFPTGHKTERGLALAHYRIWKEFAYFDNELSYRYKQALSQLLFDSQASRLNVTNRHNAKIKSSSQNSTDSFDNYRLKSLDNNYVIYTNNNSHYKFNELYTDKDILVIFEDDAESAIVDLNVTIVEELSDMKVDLLFLGWCDGRAARPVPLCAHAYAITRAGARKLIDHYEPCGMAIDEQFVIFAKNNWITYRKAHAHSYKVLNANYPVHGDRTFGIFRQKKKSLGSINGHRRKARV